MLFATGTGGVSSRPQPNQSGGLGVFSLLAQAGHALYKGNAKLAALLVGAAAAATKYRGIAPLVNVVLTIYRLLRRMR